MVKTLVSIIVQIDVTYGMLKHGLLCMNSSMRSKYVLLKLMGNPYVTLFSMDISK
jgi:hypothetical protein